MASALLCPSTGEGKTKGEQKRHTKGKVIPEEGKVIPDGLSSKCKQTKAHCGANLFGDVDKNGSIE